MDSLHALALQMIVKEFFVTSTACVVSTQIESLEKCSDRVLPRWNTHLCRHLQASSPYTSCDIHILGAHKHRPLPTIDLPEDVQAEDQRRCKVVLEEHLCIWASTNGVERGIESGDQGKGIQCDPYIRPIDAEGSLVR